MSSFQTDTLDLSLDESPLTDIGILVVDEDPAFQLGLKTFLKEYVGFEKVFTARNGLEAIRMVEQEDSIELLTVDYQMPEMNGLELLTHLQDKAPRPLGVTMITGFPSDDLNREFAHRTSSKLLTNHFLAKPVEFEKLEPVILDCFEELRRSQQLTETMTGNPEGGNSEIPLAELTESNRELLTRVELLSDKIDQNNQKVSDLRKTLLTRSFLSDFLKVLLIGVFAAMAWQSGWIDKSWEKIKSLPVFSSKAKPDQTIPPVSAPEKRESIMLPGEEALPRPDELP